MAESKLLRDVWLDGLQVFKSKWYELRSIQTKIVLMTIAVVLSSFLLVGVISFIAFGGTVQAFLLILESRNEEFLNTVTQTSEKSKNKLVGIFEENARSKGENLIKKDSLLLKPMFLDNAYSGIRDYLRNTFNFDRSLMLANFIVVEEDDIKSWQFIDRSHRKGLSIPILYDKEQGAWKAKDGNGFVTVADPSIAKITEIREATIRRIEVQNEEGKPVLAYEAIIPIFDGPADKLQEILKSGSQVSYLRYVISLEELTRTIESEQQELAKLLGGVKENSQKVLDETQSKVLLGLLGTLAIILATAAVVIILASGVATIMSRYITEPLKILSKASETIASGHYDEVVQVDSKDETGILGRNFDSMRQKIKIFTNNLQELVDERTAELNQALKVVTEKSEKIKKIMDHIDQGLLTVGPDLNVESEHSQFLNHLYPEAKGQMANTNFPELMFNSCTLNRDQQHSISTALDSILGMDALNWLGNETKLPQRVTYKNAGDARIYDFRWVPMVDDDIVQRMLICIRDLTKELRLEEEVKARKMETDRMMNTIAQILAVPAAQFTMGLRDSMKRLAEIEAMPDDRMDLRQSYVHLHTIKGTCRTMDLVSLTEIIHDAEELVQASNFEQFTAMPELRAKLKVIRGEFDNLKHTALHVLHMNQEDAKAQGENLFVLMSAVVQDALKNCRAHGVELHEFSISDQILDWDHELLDDFVATSRHAVSNTLDHGYFSPIQKGLLNPQEKVVFSLTARAESDHHTFIFADNGYGFDRESIKRVAQQKGLPFKSDGDLLDLLLLEGFSTAETVTTLSGRGAGLGALRTFCERWGGKMALSDNQPRGGRVTITIPRRVVEGSMKQAKAS